MTEKHLIGLASTYQSFSTAIIAACCFLSLSFFGMREGVGGSEGEREGRREKRGKRKEERREKREKRRERESPKVRTACPQLYLSVFQHGHHSCLLLSFCFLFRYERGSGRE
jgi:hypothetical protein